MQHGLLRCAPRTGNFGRNFGGNQPTNQPTHPLRRCCVVLIFITLVPHDLAATPTGSIIEFAATQRNMNTNHDRPVEYNMIVAGIPIVAVAEH